MRAKFNPLKTHNRATMTIKIPLSTILYSKTISSAISAPLIVYFSIRCWRTLNTVLQIKFSKKFEGHLKMSWGALFCPRAVVCPPLLYTFLIVVQKYGKVQNRIPIFRFVVQQFLLCKLFIQAWWLSGHICYMKIHKHIKV